MVRWLPGLLLVTAALPFGALSRLEACGSTDDDTPGDDDSGDDDATTGDDTPEGTPGDDDDATQGSSPGWLYTAGNHIYTRDGAIWQGRGANLPDTRSCAACAWEEPDPDEVKRRADALIDDWGATWLRLDLESYARPQPWQVQWQGVLDDPEYLADIGEIVDHIGTHPGVYVQMSLWVDPTFSSLGWPTDDTILEWELLAETFRDVPHVMFGLVNEPESNSDGALDPDVWEAMNRTVEAIRAVEDRFGTPHHLIAVQGTRDWARRLDYYVDHPITAGGGANIVYETHVYDPQSNFQVLFVEPAKTLPVVIGEFGPVEGYMTEADCVALTEQADALRIPWLGWTFHMNCPPNLLEVTSTSGCGIDMPIVPTGWGEVLIEGLGGGPGQL